MKFNLVSGLVASLAFVAFAAAPCLAGGPEVRVVVKFKRGADAKVLKQHGGGVLENHASRGVIVARVSAKKLAGLRRDPAVAFVEEDGIVEASGKGGKGKPPAPAPTPVPTTPAPSDPLPNDPSAGYPSQPAESMPWGVDRVWSGVKPSSTGTGVKVAVVDTGIDLFHPDLKDHIKGNKTFVSGTSSAMDDNGHGTHCAGTVGAMDNDIGVVGVAPDADLWAVKVLDSRGSGYSSSVAAGIDWARLSGLNIVSMSLGGPTNSSDISNACATAEAAGVLLIAASGNSGDGSTSSDETSYPAALSSVVSVGATDENEGLASFSNTNGDVEFSAPGTMVLSTMKGGSYAWYQGTSMATPHVTGAAAVRWSASATSTGSGVRADLRNYAVDLGAAGRDKGFGYGRVDLAP